MTTQHPITLTRKELYEKVWSQHERRRGRRGHTSLAIAISVSD
jgi:hypothetical protein